MTEITEGKTYPQLDEETLPIVGTDVLAIYRGPGPLSQVPASGLLDYIETGIDPLVTAAETARDEAEAAEIGAEAAEVSAQAALASATAQALLAQGYAGEAENARLAAGFYPDARANVPRGIVSTSSLVAGSGGANGTFALAFSGGNFTVAPSGTFTVSGGALTSVSITGPGLYIGASPTAPTADLTASAGLAGASVVLDAGFLVGSGEYYWTDDATAANLMALYQNVAGVATATSPLVNLTKTLDAAVVPCTVSAPNARSYPMAPVTGFSVSGVGTSQLFFGVAGATNAEGQLGSIVTATIAGVFSGAATEIVLPNGNSLPAGAIQINSPFILQPVAARSKYVLLSPAFDAQMTYIQLEWVSGTGNTLVAKLPFAETKIPATLANVRFAFQVQGDKPFGSPSLTIRNFANTADVLAATAIYNATDTAALTEAGLWADKQTVEVIRNATSGRFNIVEYPSLTLTAATLQDAALALQAPTVDEPVFAQKLTDRTWLVELMAVQYDDTSLVTGKRMNQDTHAVIMYDEGRVRSQGVLQNPYAWSINSQKANIGGKEYRYSWLYSDEGGGGSFEGDQPSTAEFAIKVGLFADATSTYDFYGVGHGLIQMVSSTLSMDGGADQKAAVVTTRLRGSSLVWTTVYDVYRPPVATPTRIGQVTIVQTLNADGVTVLHTHKIGRTMAYTSGNLNVAEGTTITGASSGATAVLVVAPAPTTGSYAGSNAAGDWYVKDVTGTFSSGENLQTAGVTRAVMDGTVGAQIGVADSYSAMLPTTSINRMKVRGAAEIVIGYEDGVQQPAALPGSTWPGTDLMQVRHGVIDTDIILEMLLLGDYPFDPPGDYSLCATSQMFAQDRTEGNRKMYVNWVSGTKQVYEGTYVGNQKYRFRVGALV
jgi:hypothetical protein